MISPQDRATLHDLIILDFAIKALQADYTKLHCLKMEQLYVRILEQLLKKLYQDFHPLRKQLASKKIRLVSYRKIDAYFCEIVVATAGEDLTLQYANKVIKQDVENILLRYVHLVD